MLIGEPYWRRPPTEDAAQASGATSASGFRLLPQLIEEFGALGYDTVEMVLADEESWDRYVAAQWLTMRRWLEANPVDEMYEAVREELTTEPAKYARYMREHLGWGVFALIAR